MKLCLRLAPLTVAFLVLTLSGAQIVTPSLLLLRASTASDEQTEKSLRPKDSPYHRHPPKGPLPSTLDPAQFKGNPVAFVAYTVAARIKELLYQEPCFCPCKKLKGHKSLLDCYVDTHGVSCKACQGEVFFSFAQHERGKSPKQIRKALRKGEWARLDVDRCVRDYQVTATEQN